MNLIRLKKSFLDAWQGVSYVFKNEQNFRIQISFACLAILAALFLQIKKNEIVVIFLLILLVLILELLNSALEKFLDVLKPRLAYQVGIIKDIMAAMVLLASLGALIVGGLIFFPYVLNLNYGF